MAMDVIECLSKWMEGTNFFNDQKKLDTMFYLMEGETYRQIAEKIDKHISYVQRVMNFLRNNGLLYWGRWAPNVYRIGMEKSIAFLDLEQINEPVEMYHKYATYANYVQAEDTKILVIYTYPKEDRSKIKGNVGDLITPFYYTNTRFTVPFFKKTHDFVKEFNNEFNSMDNDKKILMGTPSFESGKVDDHPITVYICRYCEMLPEVTPGILTEKLEQDFRDYKGIDTGYEEIRTRFNWMKEDGVIYPKNALYFNPLSFQSALVKINTKEIYRIMATFNKFNMLTRMALTRDKDVYYFYIQYPFYQFSNVMTVLDSLDPEHKTYIETKFILGETIWYKWSLEKYEENLKAVG